MSVLVLPLLFPSYYVLNLLCCSNTATSTPKFVKVRTATTAMAHERQTARKSTGPLPETRPQVLLVNYRQPPRSRPKQMARKSTTTPNSNRISKMLRKHPSQDVRHRKPSSVPGPVRNSPPRLRSCTIKTELTPQTPNNRNSSNNSMEQLEEPTQSNIHDTSSGSED